MKSVVKIVLIAFIALVLGTAVGRNIPSPKGKLTHTYEFDAGAIKELSLIYHSEEVSVIESDLDQIIIKEYKSGSGKNQKSRVTELDGILEVKAYEPPAIGIYHGYTELYLPKSYQGVLKLETSSGEIKSEMALSLARLQVKSQSGGIELSEVAAEEIKMSAKSGGIDLNKGKGDLEAEADSGAMNISDFSGTADVKNSSGRISISCTEALEELDAHTESGSVKVTVPKELAFYFFASSGTGSVRTFFRKQMEQEEEEYWAVVGEDAHSLIEISTSSGSITVMDR